MEEGDAGIFTEHTVRSKWLDGWLAGWMDGVGGSFVKDSAGPFFSLSLSLSPDFSSLSLCN